MRASPDHVAVSYAARGAKRKDVRYLDIQHATELDEARLGETSQPVAGERM
jgi:hypothetical protein